MVTNSLKEWQDVSRFVASNLERLLFLIDPNLQAFQIVRNTSQIFGLNQMLCLVQKIGVSLVHTNQIEILKE